MIHIEICYAGISEQLLMTLKLPADSTIETAIHVSGILQIFPEIDLQKNKIGVFSKIKKLHDKVKEGDRIEIYRPLMIDPKEARRRRSHK